MAFDSGFEWGRYVRETDPLTNLTSSFLDNFKQSLAYKLAQQKQKSDEQMRKKEQEALDQYRIALYNMEKFKIQQSLPKPEDIEWQKDEREFQRRKYQQEEEMRGKELETYGQPEPIKKSQVTYIHVGEKGGGAGGGQASFDFSKQPKLYSTVATDLYNLMADAYKHRNWDAFNNIKQRIDKEKEKMVSYTTNEFGQTIRSNQDYSSLINTWNQMEDLWGSEKTSAGEQKKDVKGKAKEFFAGSDKEKEVMDAFNRGDADALDKLVAKYGEAEVERIIKTQAGR